MLTLHSLYDEAGAPIPGALEFLYELMKERDPEINISHSTLPSFEQHRKFVEGKPFRCWYLIESREGEWVGYVSATKHNEIGIVLRRAARGQGYGPEAIRQLIALHKPLLSVASIRNGHWLANIAPANAHSKHIFEKLGFRKIQETYARD